MLSIVVFILLMLSPRVIYFTARRRVTPRFPILVAVVAVTAVLCSACSVASAKKTTYETLQNVRDQQCQKETTVDCPPRESYDEYQRNRAQLPDNH